MSVIDILSGSAGGGMNFDPKALLARAGAVQPVSPLAAPAPTPEGNATPLDIPTPPSANGSIVVTGNNDSRVRIKAGNNATSIANVLGEKDPTTNILSILYETGGLLFPYTPSITVNQSVNWDPLTLVHTNWDVHAYQRTPSVNISVSGIFTAQNQREGEYVMAVLHFLRVVTKSYYGIEDSKKGKAGIPPPVLYFSGYGDFIFRGIPCVIKSYNYTFDENTDSSVFWSRTNQSARLPAKMNITIELGVQIGFDKQKNDFNLDDFRTGKLLSVGGTFF